MEAKREGGSVAHSEPADVLSGLGEGAKWPNSTPAFVGVEEEEEVAALAVGLLALSGGRGRLRGVQRRSRNRRRGTGTAVAAVSMADGAGHVGEADLEEGERVCEGIGTSVSGGGGRASGRRGGRGVGAVEALSSR